MTVSPSTEQIVPGTAFRPAPTEIGRKLGVTVTLSTLPSCGPSLELVVPWRVGTTGRLQKDQAGDYRCITAGGILISQMHTNNMYQLVEKDLQPVTEESLLIHLVRFFMAQGWVGERIGAVHGHANIITLRDGWARTWYRSDIEAKFMARVLLEQIGTFLGDCDIVLELIRNENSNRGGLRTKMFLKRERPVRRITTALSAT